MAVTYTLAGAPDGVTIDENTGELTVDEGTVGAGTFFFQVESSNDATTPATTTTTPVTLTVNDDLTSSVFITYQPGLLGPCGGEIGCVVDEDGTPYPYMDDVDGNGCIVIPSNSKRIVEWDSTTDTGPDPDCCTRASHDGAVAVDTSVPCVTHVCADGEWVPMCGFATTEMVCYNLVAGPWCHGGGEGSWVTPEGTVLTDVECEPVTGTEVREAPADIEFTCGYSNNICGGQPPNPGSLTWTPAPGNVLEATGRPSDGWACFRPTFRAQFDGFPSGADGPYEVTFEFAEPGGCTNFMLYDPTGDRYLQVGSFTDPSGGSYITGSDNTILAFNGSGISGPVAVEISFIDPGDIADASILEVHVTAVGNFLPGRGDHPDDLERVEGVTLAGTVATTATTSCCECDSTAAQVAALLNSVDPVGVWTADGTKVKTTVDSSRATSYGALTFCDGKVFQPDVGCDDTTESQLVCQSTFWADPAANTPVFSCETSGGGQLFEIRPDGDSQADWDAAIAAMNSTGGNVLRFLPGNHPGRYDARGSAHDPGPAPDGVSGNHNCVDAGSNNGAVFTGTGFTGVVAALDLRGVRYWDVHNVRVTGSTGFGFRMMSSGGDANSRVKVSNIHVSGTEHARMVINAWFSDQTEPSAFIDLYNIELEGDNGTNPNPQFAEGLYVGTGDPLGSDLTHDIRVFGIHAHDLTSCGIDLKPGVTDIEIYDPWIHDIDFVAGGPVAGISILDSWTGAVAAGTVLVERPVIHDVDAPVAGSFGGPISIGDGNVTVRHLIEWDNNADNAVRVRPLTAVMPGASAHVESSTAAQNVMLNVFDPDGTGMTVTESCNLDSSNLDATEFTGPTTGTADAGFGPGTGFVPANGTAPSGTGCAATDHAQCTSTGAAGAFNEAPAS